MRDAEASSEPFDGFTMRMDYDRKLLNNKKEREKRAENAWGLLRSKKKESSSSSGFIRRIRALLKYKSLCSVNASTTSRGTLRSMLRIIFLGVAS